MPLYRTQNPYQAAVGALGNAAGTASSMTKKTEYKEPKKTVGDAIAAGIGGAWAGMQAAEYMEPGTNKALYHTLGDMFSAPTNAAATAGAETAKTGIAQGIGGSMGVEGAAAATPAATAMESAPVVAGAAQNMATGGAAATGAAVSGTSAAGMAGAGAAGAAGTTAATTGAATGALAAGTTATAGGTVAGSITGAEKGAEMGSPAGPAGAGIGALVGLTAGLLSYYL